MLPAQDFATKGKLKRYGVALLVALAFFSLFSTYIFFRRGYYNLYIINKALGSTSAVLLGIVLLIGPLSRMFSISSFAVKLRRELGIVVLFLGLAHAIVSLFFLPSKFPLSDFFGKWLVPFIFCILATSILIFLFAISNERSIKRFGEVLWWRFQSWGVRLAFILVFLHLFAMKFKDWLKWYKVGGAKELIHPEWPGASLLVGWFLAFVFLFRIAEFVSPKLGRLVFWFSSVALPIVYVATFIWGRRFVN